MNDFIKGTCTLMCPKTEIELRTREHILDFFEIDFNSKEYKPLENKVVKQFTRSAAGLRPPKNTELRTPWALRKTVEYLLTEVLCDERKPFKKRYEFIFDRLRSVRQEIVMQCLDLTTTISLIEPMVVFLAFSAYRLCKLPLKDFDPKICHQHLQECLQKLLVCYDDKCAQYNPANRILIESIYILFNIGSIDVNTRALTLPIEIKQNIFTDLSFRISMEFYRCNWFRCLNLIEDLPHILHAIVALSLPYIHRQMLLSFAYGFHSKSVGVPVKWIQKIFHLSEYEVIELSKYYNLRFVLADRCVIFNKIEFDQRKAIMPAAYVESVEFKLKDTHLPDVILLKLF